MATPMGFELLKQLFKKPATNVFPVTRDECIGCKLCIKVCPAEAIEFIPDKKKIKIHVDHCIFCSQCNDICPKNCLNMSEEFLLIK
jgi:formate hydrogenlyase subunit 6/NADH:ubiquinone oxidoreductase subunit I